MSTPEMKVGSVGWMDLTVGNADEIRDFYRKVVGWDSTDVSMGEYSDYCVHPPASETPVAGICHARGGNAGLPAQWIIYITVADLDASMKQCLELGGKVISGPKSMGESRYCIIEDPAGAVAALYMP